LLGTPTVLLFTVQLVKNEGSFFETASKV